MWIVGGAAVAVLLVCCTPLRHRVNYLIELLSGGHGLSLDYEKKRQSYYRAKFGTTEKERDPLVSDGNPFRDEKDILVV